MRLMRTYTHAVLAYLAASRLSGGRGAALASAGASLPDAPALAGSAWLLLRRRRFTRSEFYGEVCGRRRFGLPDAALHSAAVLAAFTAFAAFAYPAAGLAATRLGGRGVRPGLPFLLGWAGHIAADLLTHGADVRPPLWPLSRWRFESPVSYRERDRHGLAFTLAEHAALILVVYRSFRRRRG